MRNFIKFIRLPVHLKCLLFETTFWMIIIQVLLRVSNFKKTERILSVISKRKQAAPDLNKASVQHTIWAINVVGKYLPGLPCLRNAMAAKTMLQNRNCPVDIRVGIAIKKTGNIVCHAWVEKDGEVITGGKTSPANFLTISTNEQLFNDLKAGIK